MADLGEIANIAAAVTEGDPNIPLLKDFGVRYVETPNQPLGHKHNAALELAGDAPRYMVLPSDDLISREWVGVFRSTEADYLSPDRCGVFSTIDGRSKVLVNRPTGRRSFGAGRIFSRAVVDALGGRVWSDDIAAGLDTNSHARILAAGFAGIVHTCKDIPITDLKSDVNIWGFDIFKGEAAKVEEVLHMATWVQCK